MKVRVFGFICVDSRFIQHIFENDIMTNKERLAIEVPTQIFLRLKNQVKFPRSELIWSFLKHFLGIFKWDLTKTRTYPEPRTFPERSSTTFWLVQNVLFSFFPQKKYVLVLVQNVISKISDFQLRSGFSTERDFQNFRFSTTFWF